MGSKSTQNTSRVLDEGPPPSPPTRLLRVLVADDERMIRRALSVSLQARGHEVLEAATADEALKHLDEGRVDVALVDRKMPGKGETIIRQILDLSNPRPKVVVMSGAFGTDKDDGFPAEGVYRVQKPFSFPDLVRHIEEWALEKK